MRKSRYILTAAALLMCCTAVATAKDKTGTGNGNRSQWTQEMLDYKHDFIAEQTEMTQAQRDKFMPLYEAMEKEVFAAHRTAREQAKKVSSSKATEQDYATAARAMSQVKVNCPLFSSFRYSQANFHSLSSALLTRPRSSMALTSHPVRTSVSLTDGFRMSLGSMAP